MQHRARLNPDASLNRLFLTPLLTTLQPKMAALEIAFPVSTMWIVYAHCLLVNRDTMLFRPMQEWGG